MEFDDSITHDGRGQVWREAIGEFVDAHAGAFGIGCDCRTPEISAWI